MFVPFVMILKWESAGVCLTLCAICPFGAHAVAGNFRTPGFVNGRSIQDTPSFGSHIVFPFSLDTIRVKNGSIHSPAFYSCHIDKVDSHQEQSKSEIHFVIL